MRRDDATVRLDANQSAVADRGVKGMIPIPDAHGSDSRPFLDYVLSALADAGITDVVLVLGPEHDAVRSYYEQDGVPSRLRVRFAEQAEPLGTANAVLAAADVIGGASFLVLNADNYYPPAALRWLVEYDGDATIAFDRDTLVRDGNIDADRVRAFAVLQVTADGRLTSIIEKPGDRIDLASDDARWVGMNCWSISPAIVDACRRVPRSVRGEFELPEAVALAIADGTVVRAERMALPVLDLSQRADIAAVARRLSTLTPRP